MIYGIALESNTFDEVFETSQARYDFMKDHTDISSLECPTCGAHGKMEDTGRTYERWFMQVNKENGYERINIIILKCPVCDHYHALMFSWIKPFSLYSYDFIMGVLAD